ncbi:(2Fe-2S)-binding protein [Elongatibacter sediminis]|uniref:(2Fe-2S)-binding protein n=1 Tax=Elongatibacter sediminis TaxID=3119006 RepID=A0AAW9R8L0_9GAMM
MMKLKINGQTHELDVEGDVPLLWVIREDVGLTGTKYGCGKGLCGACIVHVDGKAVYSCVTPARFVDGKDITTIEGLGRNGEPHPLQSAWVEEQVPQCGYCQSGQIMAAAAFLREYPRPDRAAIQSAMKNLCRCGTYVRIFDAIENAARAMDHG